MVATMLQHPVADIDDLAPLFLVDQRPELLLYEHGFAPEPLRQQGQQSLQVDAHEASSQSDQQHEEQEWSQAREH